VPLPPGAEAPVLHGRIAAHPASPQFVPQLAAQLEMFVREGVQNARLQLHPAELGPVAVQIQLEAGQAQVALAAEVASTRERLLEALPQLARQLEQGGLSYDGEATPILFIPEWTAKGLGFPERGTRLDPSRVSRLDRLAVAQGADAPKDAWVH